MLVRLAQTKKKPHCFHCGFIFWNLKNLHIIRIMRDFKIYLKTCLVVPLLSKLLATPLQQLQLM